MKSNKINQSWFEMQDLRKQRLNNSVWVPLRAEKSIRNNIDRGKVDYWEEFIGYGCLMIPIKNKEKTKELEWSNMGISPIHGLNFISGRFSESDLYYRNGSLIGRYLVLNQTFNNGIDNNEWHLHQDLVINLGLKREEDVWVCPREGYSEVAKLERDRKGSPILLQIKNKFLKDYLCARNSGLYISSYFSRDKIFNERPILPWNEESISCKKGKDFWECRGWAIHEGGFPFGEKIAISHVSRIDIDEDEDVPDMTDFPTNENVKAEFYEQCFDGDKLYRVMAELWKYEWITPGSVSPITLGQEENIDIYYIVDVEGNKKSGNELKKGGNWLWFKPDLVSALLSNRGSFLKWYTKDTGVISCAPASGIHFGVNDLGLIIVYAKDIGNLPVWQQQIWAGYNTSPEGGISKELYESQVKVTPAATKAPEAYIENVIIEINKASKKQFGTSFFRGHPFISDIIKTINRFRAIDEEGLFSLAKDIARIIVDDIDVESLQKIAKPPKRTKWGSLKTIENLLSLKYPQKIARKIISPLVGVYELRHRDAHLPSSEIKKSLDLIEIDKDLPYIMQGYQMLFACVNNLHIILEIIKRWDDIENNL